MRLAHDGMSLWYGTPDAPAPAEVVEAGREVAVTVGVQPADASNRIELFYRTGQGPAKSVTAKWLRNDHSGKVQYFQAHLPAFHAGETVEYTLLCRCAGRQVPSMGKNEPWSSFRVVSRAPLMPDAIAGAAATDERRSNQSREPRGRTVDMARLIFALSSCVADGVRRAYGIQYRYMRQALGDVFGSSEVARAWDRPSEIQQRRLRNYLTEMMLVAPLAAERLATELTPDEDAGPTTATVGGRTVRLPAHVRDASQGLALYSIPLGEAQAVLDAQHAPFRAFAASPERTLLAIFVVDYRDSDFGQYFELGAALGVTPADDPGAALGMFILALPVSQPFSRDAGRQIWGYSKVLAPGLTISREGSSVRCTVVPDDPSTFALTLPRVGYRRSSDVPILPRGGLHRLPTGTSSELAVLGYTLKDGRSQRVVFTRTGEGEQFQVGGEAALRLGDGDDNNCPCGLADRSVGAICLCLLLRRLNLREKKPVACGWTERMSATISAPQPLP